jgi:predicted ATPase
VPSANTWAGTSLRPRISSQEILAKAASKIDKAAAYRLKIDLHVVKSENSKAIESALEGLRLFGIEMPAHPMGHHTTYMINS